MKTAVTLIVLALLDLSSGPYGLPDIPLQKVETSFDQRACVRFSASATLPFPPDMVFTGLSRPEEFARYIPITNPTMVFFPKLVNGQNIGPETMDSPKIIEWDTAHGKQAGPRAWTEYNFVPERHIMIQTEIGALGYEAMVPIDYFKATYEVVAGSTATSSLIRYESTRCPRSQQEVDRRAHKDEWINGAQFELKVALGALQAWCEEQTHPTPPPSQANQRQSRPTAVPTSGR